MKHVQATPAVVLAPAESKDIVDAFVNPLLRQRTEQACLINPHYETLWQDVHKLYNAGGKRLRSYMTLLTYSAYSDQPVSAILPAAAAQELLHLAMLIHDDIIDRDNTRYGVKNIASEYKDHYQEIISDESDRQHYATSAAILAGDLLLSEAYTLMTESEVDPTAVLASQKLLSRAIFQVIGGELLDTEAAFRGSDAAEPLVIAEHKTASYSFMKPFLIGATLAEAPQEQQDMLQKFGEQLGTAYQLRDDLLGVFGDETKTGKSIDGDIREGKRTLLVEEFYKLSNQADRDLFHTAFGHKEATPESVLKAKDLLLASGAKQSVEILIDAYKAHALTILGSLTISDEHRSAFGTLIELCVEREQ